MTDERINKLCAEALGECWHELRWWASLDDSDQSYMECRVCERRFGNNPNKSNPDYCTDRNAVARLVEKCDEEVFTNVMISLHYESLTFVWAFKLPPRAIALACLVAMGLLTPEQAKEAE